MTSSFFAAIRSRGAPRLSTGATSSRRHRPVPHIFGLASALIAAVVTIIATRRGIGLSWDSTDYIAVGQTLARFGFALDVTALPMTIRPPGLSIAVMIGEYVGISPSVSLRLLNAVSIAVVVLCTDTLLRRAGVRDAAWYVGVALVVVSPTLLDLTTMAWSEPPFVALVLISLVLATQRRPPWTDVFLAVCFSALFFVRYVGVFYAAPIGLFAVMRIWRERGAVHAILRGLLITVVGAVGPALWLQRNYDIDGTLTGYRVPGGGSLLRPLATFTGTLGSWVLGRPPLDGNGGIYLSWADHSTAMQLTGIVSWVVIFAVVIAAILLGYRFNVGTRTDVVGSMIVLVVTYTAFSVYRYVYHEMGPLDSRMMSGLYVPMLIVIVVCIDRLVKSPRAARGALMVGVIAVAAHGVQIGSDAVSYAREGRHWGSTIFQDAPIHRKIRALGDTANRDVEAVTDAGTNGAIGVALYSNEPQSLFAATLHWPVRNQYQYHLGYPRPCNERYFVWYNQTFLPEGKPVGAEVVFSDSWGEILSLGTCDEPIEKYWP